MRELLELFDRGRLFCSGVPFVSERTEGLDIALDASPLGAGDRLTISGGQGIATVQAVLAAWRRGLLPVVCGAALRTPEPDSLWTWQSGALVLAGHRRDATVQDCAIVHATSGSTGPARQARRSAGSFLREAHGYVSAYALAVGERVAIWAPVTHSFGWGALLGALTASCEVEIFAGFHPRLLAHALDEGRYALHVLTPQMLHLALPRVTAPKRAPRAIIAGAGAVTRDLDAAARAKLGIAIGRNYGSSETGATLGALARDDGAVGQPFADVAIIAPQPGESGELVLELLDRPAGPWPARLVRHATNDIVRRDADGAVTILGRADHIFKVNGHSFDGARISEIAKSQPGVSDAAATACERTGQRGVSDVYVVVAGTELDEAQLQRALLEALPELHASLRVRTCPSLPRDPLGKLSSQALRETIARIEYLRAHP
ncbi:MAG TPA: AMP-binding protein [Rhizomicrobium sp.]|nr:AMP-binding protein [Rhizomicrobium sp.]